MIFARCLALRIYTERINHANSNPPILKRDDLVVYAFGQGSYAVVFSFGVVVFWNVPLVKQRQFIQLHILPVLKAPLKPQLTNSLRLEIGLADSISTKMIQLETIELSDVVALSFIFAQSVVLTRMEQTVDDELYELNRILRPIEKTGRITRQRRQLLKKIGAVLRDRTHSFYEYGFHQTPPEVFNNSRIEQLYQQLRFEFDLASRMRVVNEKWNTVTDTIQFVLSLLSEQKGLRLDVTLLFLAVLAEAGLTFWQIISQ